MKTAILIAVLVEFFVQNTSATCRPVVISQKGFRLDTPTDIFVDFHQCADVVSCQAFLVTLPGQINLHDQHMQRNIHQRNKPVKITLTAKSEYLEERNGRTAYEAVFRLAYCEGPNCAPVKHIPPIDVVLNRIHGYVFLTTNRPAYRPSERVDIFIAATEQNLKARRPTNVTTPTDKGRIPVDAEDVRVIEGFGEYSYEVPLDTMFGVWWIEAYVGHVKMAEKSFLIDRYVSPTFQVKIKPDKFFVLPTDEALIGTLTAEYSYGEKVRGTYFMSFRLKRNDGTEEEFYKIPRHYNSQARIVGGGREYGVPIDKLKRILRAGESLERFAEEGEASIVIVASVTGYVESVDEGDYVDNIIFAQSPYVVDFSRSAKFYIPNTVYTLKLTVRDVVYHMPVSDVDVIIKLGTGEADSHYMSDENGEIHYSIDSFIENEESITIETGIDRVKTSFSVEKQVMDHQLVLTLRRQVADVGDRQNVIIFDTGNASPENIRFFVVSRGEIVHAGSKILEPSQRGEVSYSFEVTAAMVPQARVVAYYVLGDTVTSQSVLFRVVNQCENELVVTPRKNQVAPGGVVIIDSEGAPNSRVFIKAVNRAAYFAHNGTRLNSDVLWRKMEEYDTACSLGDGRDAENVFEEAGLSFNGINIKERFRSMFCAPKSRKKRSAPEVQVAGSTISEEKCGADGQERNDQGTCDERIQIVRRNLRRQGQPDEDIEKCVAWFKAKCALSGRKVRLPRSVASARARAEEVRVLRRNFKENWFTRELKIGETGEIAFHVRSDNSLTIFDIDAFGMSQQSPICFAKSTSIKVFQDIFIQLYLPYSVRVGEQAMIRYSVFNYRDEPVRDVEIFAKHSEELCSKFSSENFKLLQRMTVPERGEAKSYSFFITPLKVPGEGKATIEIMIPGYDHIRKELLIEERGQHNDRDHTLLLTPDEETSARLVRAEDIVFDVPKTGVIPNSVKCWLYAYSHPMGPNIEIDEFDGRLANVENFIRQPDGNGESNMIRSGPTIFVHEYRLAVWRDAVTQAQTDEAIKSIKNCYAVELKHLSNPVARKAFAIWSYHMPSTWLNAFVVKVFSAGKKIWTGMDAGPLCSAIEWVMSQQQNDGHFNSDSRLYHQAGRGQVSDPISLAAYVSISLVESKGTCPHLFSRILDVVGKAMTYVKRHKTQAQANTYTLAMGTYALSIIDQQSARVWNTLLRDRKRNEGKFVYWNGNRGIASHIEVTGYALLAEVSLNGITEENDLLTRNTAYWLISKRNANGGYKSTQDTVVALQALAKYMTVLETSDMEPPETDMEVTIHAKSKESKWHETREPNTFHLGVEDSHKRKKFDVPPATIADGAAVWVSGVETGTLTHRCSWRQHAEDGKCNFHITVSIEDDPDRVESVKILKIFVSKPENPPSPMSIIDVGMLTGFEPDENSLRRLSTDEVVDGTADRHEITLNAVKFYVSDIDSDGVHLNFKIKEVSQSINRQPSSVTAYDYYERDIRCTKLYNMDQHSVIRTSCQEAEGDQKEICKCYEGACPVCRTWDQQLHDTTCSLYGSTQRKCRKARLCQKPRGGCYNIHRDSCLAEYVYVIEVKEVGLYEDPYFMYFTANVAEVIREFRSDYSVVQGSIVKFLMRRDCYDNCRDDDRYNRIADEKSTKTGVRVQPKHYIDEGHFLIVFDTIPPFRDSDGSYVYELGANGHLEATLPNDECYCNYIDKRCETKLLKKRKRDICLIKIALRASHNRGCDV